MKQIYKYPRTHHIEGSRLQPGDEDLLSCPFSGIQNCFLVVEEKIDGANSGISFDSEGTLWLQSRGHFLTGGPREKHFNLFKTWAHCHMDVLWDVLQDQYIMYGEWVYAKHTVFYDQLPHYFLEFDIFDKKKKIFLSTAKRKNLLGSKIVSVPVLKSGYFAQQDELVSLISHSLYKSEHWRENLLDGAKKNSIKEDRIFKETDNSDLMEGLYLKIEDDDQVLERYKYVRYEFLTTIMDSESHWLSRPILPNRLAPGVDIFQPLD